MPHTAQPGFTLRFGWGLEDLRALAPGSAAVVVVDVLRFTTAVSVATSRGAVVLPYRWGDDTAARFAREQRAVLGGAGRDGSLSLSPTDLAQVSPGTRLVLPSPNGATLSLEAAALVPTVVAGCLRNAGAVARHLHGAVTVIAAGERWPDEQGRHTGPLRVAVEDLLGAGAVLAGMEGPRSPEAAAAVAAFEAARHDLPTTLRQSVSGQELAGRGWEDDVAMAAELDADPVVPVLADGAYEPRRSGR